ncbi:MAG TPA: phosphate acyltransferase PlsX [Bacteroidales bacterium]|nr:MAG: phosphate acyltransferase PlsX [Bacteroidetes bacterium GWE2_42_24]OFY25261.1 MAG: phosphate acyltransferase PlsX [Bacteroidetes bacterium GWF2_43_11]HAQ65950.1 phosphate acyltransferase PlsX [Bacteroidales bacterium]HBZ66966.1 phosphate acyltransferase PlsX [Bacteroidales bacterium]
MRLGIDVMGGDNAPKATVAGAVLARNALNTNDRIVLVGDRAQILQELDSLHVSAELFDIVHAPDVIGMDESPTRAFTAKPDASITVGFRMLLEKTIDAFSSAGNSGAMLVGSIYSVNTIQGIIRPATSTVLPREDGGVNFLLDVGTNPDVRPDVMYQFAILGSALASTVYHVDNPRVGLLNIGHEDKKGSLLVQSVFQLMKDSRDFNFIGNIEGRDIFRNKADVIVCDGFTGNVVLKEAEAIYRIMMKRGIRDEYFDRFNYESYGGTPMLGINAPVVIGHGISNDVAIKNMILLSGDICKSSMIKQIRETVHAYMNGPEL